MAAKSADPAVPPVPPGAGAEGRKLWRFVVDRFELDGHELAVLRQVVRTVDLCERLERELARAQRKAYPEGEYRVAAELARQRVVFVRLLRALKLPSGLQQDEDARERDQRRSVRGFGGLYAVPMRNRRNRAGSPPAELGELSLWLSNRGVVPVGREFAAEYAAWVAARTAWMSGNRGWPHPSWETFPHDGSRHGARVSAAVDELLQKWRARRRALTGARDG